MEDKTLFPLGPAKPARSTKCEYAPPRETVPAQVAVDFREVAAKARLCPVNPGAGCAGLFPT